MARPVTGALVERPRTAAQRLQNSLLGGGIAYLGLFLIVHAMLAFPTVGVHWHDVVCLIVVAAAQLALIWRQRTSLTPRWAAAISVTLFLTAVLEIANLPQPLAPNGYDTWFFGAIAFDLLRLTLFGGYRSAWLSMAGIVAASVTWAVLSGLPVGVGVGLIVRHVATLAVGTALAVSLRRSHATAAAFTVIERRRRMEEDVARAREGARRSAVEQVLEQAGPTLRAIADGRHFSPEDRRQMLVLEGALRDQIRTPRLSSTRLRSSLDTARRRGVNVLLLDEADEAAAEARARGIAWLAERLESTTEGRFVGRIRDMDDGGVRVSAVADDRGEAATFQ